MKKIYQIFISKTQSLQHSKCFTFILIFFFSSTLQSYAQEIEWDKTYGGSNYETFSSIQQTADGGLIIGGYSNSNISGEKSEDSDGDLDYWVIKLDALGNKEWDKTIGGNYADYLTSVQQTADGGYILGGMSYSGISGDKTQPSRGDADYWIVKLDEAGNIEWDKTFGGADLDWLISVKQTTDGGYILGGSSYSNISGEKTENARGSDDYWVVKVDASGNKEWDRTFGGSSVEFMRAIVQTADGGYMLGGETSSPIGGDRSEALVGASDYWIVKLDKNGNKVWDKTYGGSDTEWLFDMQNTSDGGIIVGGISYSGISGEKSEPNLGKADYWVLKLDAAGNLEWDKTYGGFETESLSSVQETNDGGFLLSGISDSGIGADKTEISRGEYDYWAVKLDALGNKLWDKTVGGRDTEYGGNGLQTEDGGYVLAGYTDSGIGGDKTEASRGSADYWIIKLAPYKMPEPSACNTIDFENSRTGFVTSVNTGAGVVFISNKMRRADGSYAPENHASIFNTASPTGDDLDLWTADWGNVLIINQDMNPEPNDNPWGGEMTLDFSAVGPVTMSSMKALDFDVYEGNSWVYLYDGAGKELYKAKIENLGNMSQQEVDLGNTKGVMMMKVVLDGLNSAGMLAGSGAIDDIKFCVDDNAQPTEPTSNITHVTAFPNPIERSGAIEFMLNTPGNYAVELYDLKGNLIRELKTGHATKGELVNVELNGNGLKNGLYIARIRSANDSKAIKIMLRK